MTIATPTPVVSPHSQGTLVRLIRDSDFAGAHQRQGLEIEVEEFVTAEEAEDGTAFYWGSARGGMNNVVFRHEDVEVVRTASQQANREAPSREALLRAVGSMIITGDSDGIRVTETGYDAEKGAIEVVAITDEGLEFTFHLFADSIARVIL